MKTLNYHQLTDMTVVLQSQNDYNLEVLRGKVIINEDDLRILFIQNKPRGKRSAEVMRTPHSRLVRRPDGDYTLSFHFSPNEIGIAEQLLQEMNAIVNDHLLNLKHTAA